MAGELNHSERPKLQTITTVSDGKEFKYYHENFELKLKIKNWSTITHEQFQKAVDSISNDVDWELKMKDFEKKREDE